MRVVHVVRQYRPRVGGLEDSVGALAAIQSRMDGVSARVVTLDRLFGTPGTLPPRETIDGVEIIRIPWAGSTRYPVAPSVLRHLGDADLVHVHAVDFFFDFLAATRWLHRRPLVASTHGGFFHSAALGGLKRVWMRTLTPLSCHGYRKVVACSVADAQMFADAAGDRLVTIENGISQDKLAGTSATVPGRTLLCFGRFARHKRVVETLGLLAALRRLDPRWRMILAGHAAELTLADLQREAARLGLGDAVTLVDAPDDAALRDLAGQASWFVSLSAHEGFGIAAVEALSAGLVPLLSPIPAFLRLFERGAPGTDVDPDDLESAAAKIEHLAGRFEAASGGPDDWRTRAMALAAQYDWRSVARRYVDLYGEILSRDGSR